MNKYIEASEESKQDLKEAMLEQAINNIMQDPDRIEKIIEENSDIIQDIHFKFHEGEYDIFEVGKELVNLIDRKVAYLADEDVEDAMR